MLYIITHLGVMALLEEVLTSCEAELNNILQETRNSETLDDAQLRAERLLRDVVNVEEVFPFEEHEGFEALSNSIMDVVNIIQGIVDEERRVHMRGRPCIPICEEQLVSLLNYHYTIADIARMMMVSPRTIRRRIILYGLESMTSFSDISDEELDELTESFVRDNPNCGIKSYEGFLRSNGLKLQRSRVRATMLRIDPAGIQRRMRGVLHRRTYNVSMPNSLWHIDGHHKLIRWSIVTHGGIDGYSRLPVYLHASNNNRAETVLECFVKAVEVYGLPSRVRCDKGGENVRVSEYMLCHPERGPDRGSCITGRSVHNTRIERFWRDLFSGCISSFYMLFYELEDNNLLCKDDILDIFCLHYIFLPRINHQLSIFQVGSRSDYTLLARATIRSKCLVCACDL